MPHSPANPAEILQITVNGEPRTLSPGATLADLLRQIRLPEDQVAVEVNRRLVRSADYARSLAEGDAVEIVTFVGGG